MNGSKMRGFRIPLSSILAALATVAAPTTTLAQGRADELAPRIDSIFSAWDSADSPGCALGVIKDGSFIYRRGYGMANLEHGVPLSSSSVFYIASTSKQFVAAAIILAAEQDYLSLGDDVRKHIPEMPDYGKTITIRHLLHHTRGIRDYLTLWELAGEEFADIHEPQDAIDMITRQRALNFDPGEEYLYSNSGYLLLSVIIERTSGKTLREFAHENIFEPLDMRHSHFHDDHTHISRDRAIGHVKRDDGSIAMYVSNFDLVGSGGLHTSIDDLLLWDQNFYEDKLGVALEFVELPKGKLAEYNGAYRNPVTGTIWKVEAEGHRLKVDVNGGFVFRCPERDRVHTGLGGFRARRTFREARRAQARPRAHRTRFGQLPRGRAGVAECRGACGLCRRLSQRRAGCHLDVRGKRRRAPHRRRAGRAALADGGGRIQVRRAAPPVHARRVREG